MASFIRMPFMLVFHQCKCIIAIECILFYGRHVYILVFFHVFACFLLRRCMLKSSSSRVAVKTLHNILRSLPFLFLKECYFISSRKMLEETYSEIQ